MSVAVESKFEKIRPVLDFVPEFGPPLHPLPEEKERLVNEEDCAITKYVSPDIQGFQAIIKHRYSDFNVFEISTDDTVVHLQSINVPADEEKTISDIDVVKYTDLAEEDRTLLTALTWTRIAHLAKKYLGDIKHSEAETVNVDVTGRDKEQKKRIHDLVRKYFPHLSSQTAQKEGTDGAKKSFLSVSYKTKKDLGHWPRDRPKFLQFTLYKEDYEQYYILSSLGKQLHGGKDKFGVSGTKDKRARTSQKVTVPWTTPQKLVAALKKTNVKWDKVAVGDFCYVKEELTLGKLNGNRFSIVLRNVTESDEVINAAFKSLEEHGFLNYFGLQRFGTSTVKTSEIGLALIKKEWEVAIEKIMIPRPNERPFLQKVRDFWWQYRNADVASKMIGRNNENLVEARLLYGLKVGGQTDFVGALGHIQKNIRLMYLHAYQSYVFNRVLSTRVEKHGLAVLLGDLFLSTQEMDAILTTEATATSGKEEHNKLPEVHVVTQENIGQVSIYDIVLPLPGHLVKYPENETKSLYEEVLLEDGLNFDSFTNSVREYSLGGAYRTMLARVGDLQWRIVQYSDPNQNLVLSDLEKVKGIPPIASVEDGAYKGVIVDFSLKSCHYATMALREALKVDTGRTAQSAMTDSHMAEFGQKRDASAAANGDGEEVDEGGVKKRAKVEEMA